MTARTAGTVPESVTAGLDRLRAELSALESERRRLEREDELARLAVDRARQRVLELSAAAAAGRDVDAELRQARAALEAAHDRVDEEAVAGRRFVSQRASMIKRGDVERYAVEHMDALWREQAEAVRAVVADYEAALDDADAALARLAGLAAASDQLARDAGGSPRFDVPAIDARPRRRALHELRALPLPVPARYATDDAA